MHSKIRILLIPYLPPHLTYPVNYHVITGVPCIFMELEKEKIKGPLNAREALFSRFTHAQDTYLSLLPNPSLDVQLDFALSK